MQFLRDECSGGKLVKAVLHLDEHTPHIHAHKVPLDPDGNLNAKHYLGGRDKMEGMHDLYAEYMSPLGLERGRRRSRATHEKVEEFYRSINQPVRLEVNHEEIPDPPKVLITDEARKKYKEKVLRAVLKGLEEPHRIMRDQAMLARNERAHREEAERRAEEAGQQAAERAEAAERQSAEREAAAERAAQEKITEVRREEATRFEQLRLAARDLYEKNKELHREMDELRTQRNELNESLIKLGREKLDFQMLARQYHDRLSDIPLHEVMERLGYGNERQGGAYVYRDGQGQVALRVEEQNMFDGRNQLVCRNSLDLAVHMHRHHKGVEGFTQEHAIEYLRQEFGDERAAGAVMAHREQTVLEFFDRTRQERERSLVPQRGDDPWRGRAEDDQRGARNHETHDHKTPSFGGR